LSVQVNVSVMFLVKPSSSHCLGLFICILFNKLHVDSHGNSPQWAAAPGVVMEGHRGLYSAP